MSPTLPGASPPDVGVLIPAAGRGERAGPGQLKQLRPIAGVPMLLRALQPFLHHAMVRQVVVALPADLCPTPPPWLRGVMGERVRLVAGGTTRALSVAAALAALDPRCAVVLVHDGARPFVSEETIDAVIGAARAVGGAVAAVPIGDTIKRTDGAGRVVETVERQNLWRAQTPQGFPRPMLEAAYARARDRAHTLDVTDDAQLVEAAGFPVVLVRDRASNIKVTAAEDFALAEALAADR